MSTALMRKDMDDTVQSYQENLSHIVGTAKDTALKPVRLATSKTALRTYVTTFLFVVSGICLFSLAITAYLFFYWSYIPRIGFSRNIYLQYDTIPHDCRTYMSTYSTGSDSVLSQLISSVKGSSSSDVQDDTFSIKCGASPSPWGTTVVYPDIISQQAYDINVKLRIPRTPSNTGIGNFMIDARLLSTRTTTTSILVPDYTNYFSLQPSSFPSSQLAPTVIAHSRRSAILPYRSPLITLLSNMFNLPWYILGYQTDTLTISTQIFNKVAFPPTRGSTPSEFHLQIQSPNGIQMQIYNAKVDFRARFSGLRYLMYNFRFITGGVFVGIFFITECIATIAMWGVLNFVVFKNRQQNETTGKEEELLKLKKEEDGDTDVDVKKEEAMSDTERTFPSFAGHPKLKYESSSDVANIKKEDEGMVKDEGARVVTQTGEADDEDEDADFVLDDTEAWRDSGLGTSMESGRERRDLRKRRSRGSSRDGFR